MLPHFEGKTPTTSRTRQLRILVCDDEPIVRDSLKMLLSALGHVVAVAQSAPEALEKYDLHDFDIIMTDFLMPGMKGDEFARAIKALDQSKPVIMVSGSLLDGPPVSVDVLLRKPFTLDEIQQAIARVAME